ncbi:putative amidohydrolase YtcJ [Novosphingobium sp. 1529]|uniref:amidohydrolase n=1 Tax=Novosphingobium sp. 1529 TaxID=3156424 RepID=UPI003398E375
MKNVRHSIRRLTLAMAATALGAPSLVAAKAPVPAPQAADLVLRNGAIYLVEPERKWAQALAVKDGRIIALGTDRDIARFTGAKTHVVDLQQRMVMPGLIDGHVHLSTAAAELQIYNCVFSAYGDFDAVIASVRACAAKVPAGEWILGQSWGSGLYGRLADAKSLALLDQASGDHPVMLRNDSIHDRWVNSRALAIAGISATTPDPENGKIGRDPGTGALNGLLLESATSLVERHVPALVTKTDVEQEADALQVGVRYLNSRGVTGFDDAGVVFGNSHFSDARAYKALDQRGTLTAHAALSMLIDPDKPDIDEIYSHRAEINSATLSMNFAKIFVDGVMVSHTAEFLEPYLPDAAHGADFRGTTKMSAERLAQLVTALDARGISVKMHVAGDGSVRMALDAIAAARKANGAGGPIHTLAHAGYIAGSDIDRVRQLHAAIDASPTVWYPGPILTGTEAVIGKERADHYWPFRTFVAHGVLVAGGTDWKTLPGEFSDLWDGMQGMVTRRNPTGAAPGALWPEQAVDVGTMIRFYTLNSAKALGIDQRTGSISVGKLADFVVLDKNLFKIPADTIAKTNVDMTFFGGKLVYERAKN